MQRLPVLKNAAAALALLLAACSLQSSPTAADASLGVSAKPLKGTVTIDVISDVQGDLGDFARTLTDQASLGAADALVVNGDLVPSGSVPEYDDFFEVLNDNPHPRALRFTIGNHEFYTGESADTLIARFLRYTEMPNLYSSEVIRGVPMIYLGSREVPSETGLSSLGEAQLDWLDRTLARYATRHAPVFVFSHHPVSQTLGPDTPDFYCCQYSEAEEARLLEILGDYPNVILFGGHSHYDLYRDDWAVRRSAPGSKYGSFLWVNTGHIQTMWEPDGDEEVTTTTASHQGLRLYVKQGEVVIEARDFLNDTIIRTLTIDNPQGSALDLGPLTLEHPKVKPGATAALSTHLRNLGEQRVGQTAQLRFAVPAGWERVRSVSLPRLSPGQALTLRAPLNVPREADFEVYPLSVTLHTKGRAQARAETLLDVVRAAPGEPIGEEVIFEESFDGLQELLQPAEDEAIANTILGWTHTTPAGWTITNASAMPQGVTEWQGWSFATPAFWTSADQQGRQDFAGASGVLAVADADEWDDLNSPSSAGTFDSTLSTPSLPVSGGETVYLGFNSHYQHYAQQTATVTARFDNGEAVELLRYGPDATADNAGQDQTDAYVNVEVTIPENATALRLEWRLAEAGNDWFWAIDNIVTSR